MKKITKYFLVLTVILISGFLGSQVNAQEVSDTEISYGSEYVFNTGNTDYLSVTTLSDNKFVVVYKDGGNANYGTAVIGDMSGDTITYGSEYVFNTGNTDYLSVTTLSENKFVVVYKDGGNANYGTAIIGDMSGDTITYGSEYVFNTGNTDYLSVTTSFRIIGL